MCLLVTCESSSLFACIVSFKWARNTNDTAPEKLIGRFERGDGAGGGLRAKSVSPFSQLNVNQRYMALLKI